ncbi:hypothetical protein [Rummeliibacillus stabekisii]|uniref:hypothetical protein n=1 Tax=Rummeliibacillus stabekisii TaxID=241244 RepID=UPI00131492BC|nr:hypothetical protein [Rummeliibacillus stabekisii]
MRELENGELFTVLILKRSGNIKLSKDKHRAIPQQSTLFPLRLYFNFLLVATLRHQ